MNIKEQLKQAIETRNANREAKVKALPKCINEFLGNTLPRAIAQDEQEVTIVFTMKIVSKTLWEELNNYDSSLVDLIAEVIDDMYQPYISGLVINNGYLENGNRDIRITFYINQD